MKFDTKNAAPTKNCLNSFVRPNKYIPESKKLDDDSGLGRQEYFEVFVVATPELKSERIQGNTSENKRVVTKDGLDELRGLLNKLYISDSPKSVVPDMKQLNTSDKKGMDTVKKVSFDDGLGLKEKQVYSYKQKAMVTVRHSARVA